MYLFVYLNIYFLQNVNGFWNVLFLNKGNFKHISPTIMNTTPNI